MTRQCQGAPAGVVPRSKTMSSPWRGTGGRFRCNAFFFPSFCFCFYVFFFCSNKNSNYAAKRRKKKVPGVRFNCWVKHRSLKASEILRNNSNNNNNSLSVEQEGNSHAGESLRTRGGGVFCGTPGAATTAPAPAAVRGGRGGRGGEGGGEGRRGITKTPKSIQ